MSSGGDDIRNGDKHESDAEDADNEDADGVIEAECAVNKDINKHTESYEIEDEDEQHELIKTHLGGKSGLILFHANVNGFKTNGIRIEATLKRSEPKPTVVMLNETKTDEGDPLHLHGYKLVSRRDRDENGGGIAVFCLAEKSIMSPTSNKQKRRRNMKGAGYACTLTKVLYWCAAGTAHQTNTPMA